MNLGKQGSEMKKTFFILVVGDNLSDCSNLISRIQQLDTGKIFYKASDSLGLIETFQEVEDAADCILQTEVRVIIDLNLPFFEAYVCLQALAGYDFNCPVRVYLLEDEYTIKASPCIRQYIIAGRFHKPLNACEIEYILTDCTADYFQKEINSTSGISFNKYY